MAAPGTDAEPPDPARPPVQRRVVPDREYKTAYCDFFQCRLPAGLHERLNGWAARQGQRLENLALEILEVAAAERKSRSTEGASEKNPSP